MTLIKYKIEKHEKEILENSGIWSYLLDVPDNSDHDAYNLLLAAAYYFAQVRDMDVTIAKQVHDTLMYYRIYYLDQNGYRITDKEQKAIKFIKSRICLISKDLCKEERHVFEMTNTMILNIILKREWARFK